MVKLTLSLIERECLKQQSQKSLTKQVNKNHLKRLTHLFMVGNSIDEICDISICQNLKVIYLQKNLIDRIENLNFAVNLTHLYLQHNEITKIENLENLINLKKLYLGYNSIAVIEGLDKLSKLSELHVEKQRLDVGERLCFDPRTASTLSTCLTHLNVSGNKIISLRDINEFEKLTTLEAKDNLISSIEDLTDTISSLKQLKHAYLQGNPVTKITRYRENIIGNSISLCTLDDKRITENSRTFLKCFKREKLQQSRKKLEMTLSEDITSSLNLPPAFRRSVSRAIFQNINPKLSFPGIVNAGDLEPQIFPPLRPTISIKPEIDHRVLPRPFWKNKNSKQKLEKSTVVPSVGQFSTFL